MQRAVNAPALRAYEGSNPSACTKIKEPLDGR